MSDSTIILKKSAVAGKLPTSGQLEPGELAINLADKVLYSKDTSGTIFKIGGSDKFSIPNWDPTASYKANDLVFYQNRLYQAKIDLAPNPTFPANSWDERITKSSSDIPPFSVSAQYSAGDMVTHGNKLYTALVDITTPSVFVPAQWKLVGSPVTVSDTAPANPLPGDLWIDSTDSDFKTYLYYNDGSSSQWVFLSSANPILPGNVLLTAPKAGTSQSITAADPADVPLTLTGGDKALDAIGDVEITGAATITADDPATVPLTLTGAAGQTADLLKAGNYRIDKVGYVFSVRQFANDYFSAGEFSVTPHMRMTPDQLLYRTDGSNYTRLSFSKNDVTLIASGSHTLALMNANSVVTAGKGDARYVQKAGDTMTGALVVNSTVTANLLRTGTANTSIQMNSNHLGNDLSGILCGTNAVVPAQNRSLGGTDGAIDLGNGGKRWHRLYASVGTINTSDRNEKKDIIESDLGLDFINQLKPVSYRWKDENIGGGQLHYGVIAQDVEPLVNADAYMVQKDQLEDGRERYSVAYTEMIAPLIKAVQEMSAEIESLKTQLAEVKNNG